MWTDWKKHLVRIKTGRELENACFILIISPAIPFLLKKTEHFYTLTPLIYFIALKELSAFSQPNLILGLNYFSIVSNYSLSYIFIPKDNRKIKFKPKINYRQFSS